MNAESELTYDGTNLLLTGNSHNFNFKTTSNYSGNSIGFFDHSSSSTDGRFQYEHSTDEFLFETGSDWRLRLGNDTLRAQSDNVYKLGSSSYRFANIYTNYISGIINVASTQTIAEFRNSHSTYGGGVQFKSNNTYGTLELTNYNNSARATLYNSTGGWHWDSNLQFHSTVSPWTNNNVNLGTTSKHWLNCFTNYLTCGDNNSNGSVASFKGGNYNQINIAHSGNSSWGLLLSNSNNTSNSGYHQSTSGNNLSCAIINVNSDALYLGTNNIGRWRVEHDGHFIPVGNNSYDIGSTGNRVRNVYTNDLNLSNKGSTNSVDNTWGDYTIQEGENDLFLINNRNGKKYTFLLKEVS